MARFYQDCQTAGYFASLAVGSYTLSDLRKKGIQNDDISSMIISPGYEVQAYENDNFAGAEITFKAGTIGCLTANGWNDRISSLRVRVTFSGK